MIYVVKYFVLGHLSVFSSNGIAYVMMRSFLMEMFFYRSCGVERFAHACNTGHCKTTHWMVFKAFFVKNYHDKRRGIVAFCFGNKGVNMRYEKSKTFPHSRSLKDIIQNNITFVELNYFTHSLYFKLSTNTDISSSKFWSSELEGPQNRKK